MLRPQQGQTWAMSTQSPQATVLHASSPAGWLSDGAQVLLRRMGGGKSHALGSAALRVLGVLREARERDRSRSILFWPSRPDGTAVFHALAALDQIGRCDQEQLCTLYFPWSRNVGQVQRTLLVHRTALLNRIMPVLGRVYQDRTQSAYSLLMGLQSIKHVGSSGKSEKKLKRALERDTQLLHPSLYEATPQVGVTPDGVTRYEEYFLRRLRRHTWISDCSDHIANIADPIRTPNVMIGVQAEGLERSVSERNLINPKRGGRRPDIVLLDVTRRARNRMGGASQWRRRVKELTARLLDLYGATAPPILALADDVFVAQALRWDLIKTYDEKRLQTSSTRPAALDAVLMGASDLLDDRPIGGPVAAEVRVETYGAEILSFSEFGLKLRRGLTEIGEDVLAEAVGQGMNAIQQLIGLPGLPRQLHEFAEANYERFERQGLLARYDRMAPRGIIRAAIQSGSAGARHEQLIAFMAAMDKYFLAAETNNPGCALFNAALRKLATDKGRVLVVFSSELLRGFAEWRLEEDDELKEVREADGLDLTFVDRREAAELLASAANNTEPIIDRVLLMEPGPEDLLSLIALPHLPARVDVIAHLARVEHTLRRLRILRVIDGIEPISARLLWLEKELERVLDGRAIDLPDLDAVPAMPRIGTLDLTTGVSGGAEPTRILGTSGGFSVRAYDHSEFAAYDPDALQVFLRKTAQSLKVGDQICVFTPDFVEAARERLNLAANASDVLALYHKDVYAAAKRLPGFDFSQRADALRARMVAIDSSLQLPGMQAMRSWIDVEHLIGAARNRVRPQAPRSAKHFMCFMKALGIADEPARLYWDFGVFWTRSMRIRSGAAFHQVFMGVLIDPHGTAAHLPPERRDDVWRIYETAEHHVVTVTRNDREEKTS